MVIFVFLYFFIYSKKNINKKVTIPKKPLNSYFYFIIFL